MVFSGSLPAGVPSGLYAGLIRSARRSGCRSFLDSSGDALRRGVKERPDVVKPNREEAEWLTGMVIRDIPSARKALECILSMGAQSVALSLGAEGLLWCPGKGAPVLHARATAVEGRSAVGSGDATLAGLAYAIASGWNAERTVRWAAACGTANCLAKSPGRIRAADVRRVEKTVYVQTLPGLDGMQG